MISDDYSKPNIDLNIKTVGNGSKSDKNFPERFLNFFLYQI